MLVPKLFYGKTSDVKQTCKKLAKKVKKSFDVLGLYSNLELIDTKDFDGNIVLYGPSPLIGGENHFHMYIWLWMLGDVYGFDEKFSSKVKDDVLFLCKTKPWALLSVMTSMNSSWVFDKKAEFWEAVFRFFDIYEGEGERFIFSSPPRSIWKHPTLIIRVLVKMGVPKSEFQQKNNLFFNGLVLPPFWHLVKKYNLPTDFPPYVPPKSQ